MLQIVERADISTADWNGFVEQHPGGWFWHTSHWIDYSLAYTPRSVDRSFVALVDGRIVGLAPLVTLEGHPVHGGQITPSPLIDGSRYDIAETMYAYSTLNGSSLPVQLRPGVVPAGPPPPALRAHAGYTYVVDLRYDEETLWRHLRRSYKSLINKAQRELTLGVYAKPEYVAIAEALHLRVAGYQTRDPLTWQMMGEWTTLGYGLVALAVDLTLGPLAFAYVIRYKEWAYYASGGSLRPNLSHALQWQLMRTLRTDADTHLYEVGHDAGDGASAKDRGIAHFKSGFGAFKVPVVVVSDARWTPS